MPSPLHLAIAAAMLAAAPAAAAQGSGAAAPAQWRSWVSVCRVDRQAADASLPAPEGRAGRDCEDRPLRGLVSEQDIPAALRRRRFQGTSRLELEVTPAGAAASCRVDDGSGDPRLDRLACDLVARRARFRPLYAAPGRPLATRHRIDVGWMTTDVPPQPFFFAPPIEPPQPVHADFTRPRPWPRLTWHNPIALVAVPPIQGSYPSVAARESGTAGVDLLVSAERGIEGCVVGQSAGDPALDEAACRVARTLELRYHRPCEICANQFVPVQVVWRREGGSHIRYPLPFLARPEFGGPPPRDPADTRTALAQRPLPAPIDFAVTARDYRRIRDRAMRADRFVARVAVDAEGRPSACRTQISTGNQAIDARTCEIIMRRARYRPRTDVFGDPVPDGVGHIVNLPPLG